jgi:hypothetical protein
MRLSIFTPTHRPIYLNDAFESLLEQSFSDWEWVIIPNSATGSTVEIPKHIASHPQVKVIPASTELAKQGIGALKLFACQQCSGDYFIELDHDDILTPNALKAIDQAATDTGAGFIYSDFTNFYPDGSCQIFGEAYGWKNYPFEFRGHTYTAMRAFATNACSLHLIFHAPNHVRVWSRDAYFKAGGHDPKMHVVDDHDLLCRTYLTGAEFHHIPECLYLYRLQEGDQNSYLQMNDDIQRMQQEVSNKYTYQLITEWCRRHNHPMINLGHPAECPPAYQQVALENAPIKGDPRYGIPLPDNSVGCVRAVDFLQHVQRHSTLPHAQTQEPKPLSTIEMMNEIYRVLVPGGWLISSTPSTDGRGAFQDPTHQSFWNANSFWYYTQREQARLIPEINCRFQGTRLWQAFQTDWHKQNNILYVHADLVALKGQEQSGLVTI